MNQLLRKPKRQIDPRIDVKERAESSASEVEFTTSHPPLFQAFDFLQKSCNLRFLIPQEACV